ncbi:YihY/virulence factor BrkB family protein [Synechococcus sp. PCC 6312]|uniref:YihY/virulence factor BrkB family protein n=1 Tax=Synechococcus sp. (strain ATCC 27167 / PCC 6312) TaxID=195253 RepID=UPI00029ED113|nr:YihY/virulence factor BrkB family protein [Synechococcus sp. PCC 6312]AFY62692.1 putative membrane protein [Synechococcus sp. PCC 6312]
MPLKRNNFPRASVAQIIRYLQSVVLPATPTQLIVQTGRLWNQNHCTQMAAALAYYALLSLFPLLLVALSGLGYFLGPGSVGFQTIKASIEPFLPTTVHDLVQETMYALHQSSTGAGLVGFILLLFSASTVFTSLRTAINQIWQSQYPRPQPPSLQGAMLSILLNRLLAFLLVIGTALLLFVSLIMNIVVELILMLVATFQDSFSLLQLDNFKLAQGLQGVSSLFLLALATSILFKILPSARVQWRDIWLGALLTTGLLKGLQQLVSNSIITIGSHFLSYGVIGNVMILLLWIYLTCAIFLMGCQLSYVYAHLLGRYRTKGLE